MQINNKFKLWDKVKLLQWNEELFISRISVDYEWYISYLLWDYSMEYNWYNEYMILIPN